MKTFECFPGRETNYWSLLIAELKDEWSYKFTPPYAFILHFISQRILLQKLTFTARRYTTIAVAKTYSFLLLLYWNRGFEFHLVGWMCMCVTVAVCTCRGFVASRYLLRRKNECIKTRFLHPNDRTFWAALTSFDIHYPASYTTRTGSFSRG
jgi:hypothetical protein